MIRAIDYVSEEAKTQAQTQALGALMNSFTDEMAKGLMAAVQSGQIKEWDDPESFEELQNKLLESLKAANWTEVAAFSTPRNPRNGPSPLLVFGDRMAMPPEKPGGNGGWGQAPTRSSRIPRNIWIQINQ